MVVSLECELKAETPEALRVWARAELGYVAEGVRGLAALKFALLRERITALQPLAEAEKAALRAALPVAMPSETLTEMPVQSLARAQKSLKAPVFEAIPSKA